MPDNAELEPCNCEHTNHFDDENGARTKHEYLGVLAGTETRAFVGHVCNDCANTCLKRFPVNL